MTKTTMGLKAIKRLNTALRDYFIIAAIILAIGIAGSVTYPF